MSHRRLLRRMWARLSDRQQRGARIGGATTIALHTHFEPKRVRKEAASSRCRGMKSAQSFKSVKSQERL